MMDGLKGWQEEWPEPRTPVCVSILWVTVVTSLGLLNTDLGAFPTNHFNCAGDKQLTNNERELVTSTACSQDCQER